MGKEKKYFKFRYQVKTLKFHVNSSKQSKKKTIQISTFCESLSNVNITYMFSRKQFATSRQPNDKTVKIKPLKKGLVVPLILETSHA